MKRIFSLSLLLSFLMFPALAQVEVGVKAGVNYSFYQFKNVPEYADRAAPMVGIFGGIFLAVPVTEKVFVRPECLLSIRGWNDQDETNNLATGLVYLDFPVLAGYQVSPKFKVLAGPQVGYIIGYHLEQQNRFETAFAGGVSYNLFKSLEVEARYNHGFTSLKEGDYFSGVGSNLDGPYKGGKNRTVLLSLAYQVKAK